MKYNAFAQLFREQAVGYNDSTLIPNSTVTLWANLAKDNIAKEIVTRVRAGADYFDLDLTTDLVVDQREYAFPYDVLKNIRIVQAYIDSKWRRLAEFDINNYRLGGNNQKPYYGAKPTEAFTGATLDETTITEQFTDENPEFDVDGKSIVIYSETVTAVTDGLKLKATIYPVDFVDGDWAGGNDMSIRTSTTTTSMPRQSHDTMLMSAVILYKESRKIPLNQTEQGYQNALSTMFVTLDDINTDETITAVVPIDDGFSY